MDHRPEHGIPRSPFRDHLGLRVVEITRGQAVLELEVTAPLLNYVGRLNGGVVASMIDMAGTLAGSDIGDGAAPRTAITLSFAVSFLGTTTSGKVRAVGTVRGGGRSVFTSGVDVFDAEGTLIATGQGTHRYLKQEAPELPGSLTGS